MTLPHTFKRIRLHLARSKEFPSGSARVRRFWNGADEQIGRLVHKPGGAEHARWVFDYDASRTDDDESGYRFGAHVFAPGEYVSIRDEANEVHTFQVKSIEPAS